MNTYPRQRLRNPENVNPGKKVPLMRLTSSPWLPVGLAGVQLVDAVLCTRPVGFVAECLEDVRFPREYWPVLAPIKVAAAAGLLAGRRMPDVGFATCAGLVLYFGTAVGLHLRAHDLGRNLCNATGLLGVSAMVGIHFFQLQRLAEDVGPSPDGNQQPRCLRALPSGS